MCRSDLISGEFIGYDCMSGVHEPAERTTGYGFFKGWVSTKSRSEVLVAQPLYINSTLRATL